MKQWFDKIFHGVKTDKEIDTEKQIEAIVNGRMNGTIKVERRCGGLRYRHIYKENYSEEVWNSK